MIFMSVFFKTNFTKVVFTLSLILFGGATITTAETFETVTSNGAVQNRVDIAILGDGYTAAQMDKYRADVQQFLQGVFQQEPYREYQRYYNVHRIDVVSNQSGADHSDRSPQVFVDTALDGAFNCSNIQRLVCVNNTKVNQVIARTLPSSAYYDVILILVNDPEYGGSGGSLAVASTHPSAVELILHEVGHSFGLLADEYTGGGPSCNPNVEPSQANATRQTVRELIKWNAWISPATPIPTMTTTAALPGLYVGSKYCDTGLYRPTYNSKMNSLGVPFEQINTEQHVKRVYNFVSPIDSSSPAETNITLTAAQSQTFSVATPQPFTHGLNIEWRVDGQPAAGGASFNLAGSSLSSGAHTVQVIVSDPTAFVRNDPAQVLRATRSWNINIQAVTRRTQFDFDGDGKADVSVYRPLESSWYIQGSQSGFVGSRFGAPTDKPAPADYDGDGKTDIAVYRPSEGSWYILNSRTGAFTGVHFGASEDIPAPADFDGDGRAEIAVYRPSEGNWFMFNLTNNAVTGARFGLSGDIPVAADYDGDGKADVAVYRPSEGNWYIQRSRDGFFGIKWGIPSDKPVVGDYDGDGRADQAVYRPSEGNWYILKSRDGFTGIHWGAAADLPVAADYDGDGKTDIAVFRPSDGDWYLLKSRDGFSSLHFGSPGDKPAPNSFVP